jgi:hypothetical protein
VRDQTLESLPLHERERAEYYAERFADSFQHYEPELAREDALEQAREFETIVWIKMGPQN